MKITVDGVDLFEVTDAQKKVLCSEIASGDLDADLKRRLMWVINHKYQMCFQRLKSEWDSKLAALGVSQIPLDQDKYAALVFSQPSYQDADAKLAAQAAENAISSPSL